MENIEGAGLRRAAGGMLAIVYLPNAPEGSVLQNGEEN
jgi:hypothetical protein